MWTGWVFSLYMQKYFLGRNDWAENEKFNEVVFLSGDNADPVKAASAIISKYGDRKPVMISGVRRGSHNADRRGQRRFLGKAAS